MQTSRLGRPCLFLALLLAATGRETPAGGAADNPWPTNYAKHEACPPHSESFPSLPGTRWCDVITFAGGVAPGAMAVGKNKWWKEGLDLFADNVNAHGGLRLGEHAIGYVKVNLTTVDIDDTADFVKLYGELCANDTVSFLLAPLPSKNAQFVREQVRCEATESSTGKIYLAADAFDELNEFENLFSVYNVDIHRWGNEPIDLLYELGARTFAIAGKKDKPNQETAYQLTRAIYNRSDTKLSYSPGDLVAVGEDATLLDHVDKLIGSKPDVFIGLGDVDTFTSLLKHFWQARYAPKCAFFISGLAVTDELMHDSYTQKNSNPENRVVYDQWMGTISWTKDMHYGGKCRWGNATDPYGDSHAENMTDDCDRRWSRYLGSASNFDAKMGEQLRRKGSELTYYHAKAAATLLMVQLAVELAPGELAPGGWGMSATQLKDTNSMRTALYAVDQDTFFGSMKIVQGEHGGGHNAGFQLALAQFQNNLNVPTLIKSESFPYGKPAVYPAAWPCELTDWWCPKWYELVLLVVVLLVLFVCVTFACAKKARKGERQRVWSVMRQSLLGSDFALPQQELSNQNVEGRWQKAAQTAAAMTQAHEGAGSRPASPEASTDGPAGGAEKTVGRSPHRKRRGDHGEIHVMFTDMHLRELEPTSWREDTVGTGSYGVVYRARWRGQRVAIKELKIPREPENTGGRAREAYRERLRTITSSFVQEVAVCCDLAHPNLVRMLGYSAHPTSNGDGLLLVQEYMGGKALDEQLYEEGWQPTSLQALKAAIDVARGMEYLHSAFEDPQYGRRNPIIHRDLKSPNLLLTRPPPRSAMDLDTTLKISDFGLTRDKELEAEAMQTAMMTGCGSVLWMAPEILVADKYNEQVDVFSFAMCMVELVDGRLPWQGVCSPAEVPHKVIAKQRPLRQLSKAEDSMSAMIEKCWHHNPSSRPSFETIRRELEAEAEARGLDCGEQIPIPRTSDARGAE